MRIFTHQTDVDGPEDPYAIYNHIWANWANFTAIGLLPKSFKILLDFTQKPT